MNSNTYKAIRFDQAGDANVLKLVDIPIQKPKRQEVRLRIESIGLNRAEVMFRKDQYFESPRFPSGLGYEASGIIEDIGEAVSGLNIGDRVSTIPCFSMAEYNVYGEKAIVPAYAVAAYPQNLTPAQGAAIWMPYITAWGALVEIARIKPGDTVLVTAASSSVGIGAIQMAKAIGATVIATTRGPEKEAFIRDNGADHVIKTDSEDLVARVLQVTCHNGANVIFDPVAGPTLLKLAEAAAHKATIFQYGALDDRVTPYPLQTAVAKGLTIRGYNMFEVVTSPQPLIRAKNYIFTGLQNGQLRPQIDHRPFTLEQMSEAHHYMESNQQRGKIVINVNTPNKRL